MKNSTQTHIPVFIYLYIFIYNIYIGMHIYIYTYIIYKYIYLEWDHTILFFITWMFQIVFIPQYVYSTFLPYSSLYGVLLWE